MGFDSGNNRLFFGETLQEEKSIIISKFEERLKIENQFKIEGEAFTRIKRLENEITSYLNIKKNLIVQELDMIRRFLIMILRQLDNCSGREGVFCTFY